MTNSPASSPQGLFYNIKAEAPWCEVRIPEVPRTLLCNYRSHAGIMDIANEVIKLITRFFPYSIDSLELDKCVVSAPRVSGWAVPFTRTRDHD